MLKTKWKDKTKNGSPVVIHTEFQGKLIASVQKWYGVWASVTYNSDGTVYGWDSVFGSEPARDYNLVEDKPEPAKVVVHLIRSTSSNSFYGAGNLTAYSGDPKYLGLSWEPVASKEVEFIPGEFHV